VARSCAATAPVSPFTFNLQVELRATFQRAARCKPEKLLELEGGNAMLMNDKKTAAELGISRRKLWTMNSMGQLPAPIRMGRSVRWRVSDIEEWVRLGCPSREVFEAAKGAA
jgi:predicted DNA-binding transcriptional regulator AlpA